MNSFTDIGQYRNVVKAVKEHHDYKGKDEQGSPIYIHDIPYPTLKFRGTTKLHGTNSAVVKFPDGHYEYESRERVLSIKEDNAGFMLTMLNIDVAKLFEGIEFKEHCAIFGEWAGLGIQKGVAISSLPKMWVIFAVKVDSVYQDMSKYAHLKMEDKRIFNILQFPGFEIEIDFNTPEIAQNRLQQLTEAVEAQCPVGKYFGIDGVGEGIVYEYINGTDRYIFKVKGEKHQNSKVKTLTTVDTEAIKNLRDFAEYAVTDNRCSQGVDKMKELGIPLDLEHTGDYLRWIYNDVIKEEQDTIVKNQLEVKKLGSYISAKAKTYWMKYLNGIPL
jgi:RNA ligase